ncbi:MAG: hypothetical protein KJ069_18070 [Anaerolineae bacterium]|nr:hypothetical protein [Anaerolineae bacterium]
MDESEFSKAITQGLGRVIPYLQTHDALPFMDAILEACLHNTTCDPQSEGSRAAYLFEVIHLTGQVSFFKDHIVKQLELAEDYHDLTQLFELARMFAQLENQDARQVMYRHLMKAIEQSNVEGTPYNIGLVDALADELMELDGLDGFLFVIDQIGAKLQQDDTHRIDDCILREAKYRFGDNEVDEFIVQFSATNPNVGAYARAIDEYLKRIHESSPPAKCSYDYKAFKARLLNWQGNIPPFIPIVWGNKHATDQELVEAATDIINITEPNLLTAYLRIFRWRRFPLDHTILMNLAQAEDEQIAIAALDALGNITHPDVRHLALGLLSTKTHIALAIKLLTSNPSNCDFELIYQALDSVYTSDDWHDVGWSFKRLVEIRPSPEARDVLITLYENIPCSNCRRAFIKAMQKSFVLPDWIINEGKYDSDSDIRAFCIELTRVNQDGIERN